MPVLFINLLDISASDVERVDPLFLRQALNYQEMETPTMISEDYSFYGLRVPSVFFFLGTGTGIALHSNNFDFDETVLLQGLELYKTLLNA